MTTATEMIPALGAAVLVRFEDLAIRCTVVDVKNSWGKPRLLVKPTAGVGSQWVEMGRVTVPPTVHAGEAHEHSAEKASLDQRSQNNYCGECRDWYKPLPRLGR